MDLTNELVKHPVFGTGKVISHDDMRITIQFSKEIEKRFIYPDAFEKYLTICDPAAAQNVLADLTAKTKQIKAQQRMEEDAERKSLKNPAPAAQKRKSTLKTKPPKAKAKDD